MSKGGFQVDFDLNPGISLKSSAISLLKYHLYLIFLPNSSKSLLRSASLISLGISTKLKPFSKTFISTGVRTFLLQEAVFLFLKHNSVPEEEVQFPAVEICLALLIVT